MTAIRCPDCNTDNASDNSFCETCGLHLGAARKQAEATTDDEAPIPRSADRSTLPSSRRGASRRRRAPTPVDDQRAIQRELGKARGTVKTIRLLYGVLSLPALGFALLALIAAGSVSGQEGSGAIWVVAIASTVSGLLLLAGALFAHLHPLAWTLAVACLFTLSAVASLADGGFDWLSTFIAVALWATVPQMLKIHRLMREHPDLVDTSKLRRRERRTGVAEGETRARAAQRSRRQAKSNVKTFAMVGGIIVALIVGIWLAITLSSDSGSNAYGSRQWAATSYTDAEIARMSAAFGPRIDSFEHAWRIGDLAAIESMFTETKRASLWPKIVSLLERREWIDELPPLDEPDITTRGSAGRDAYFPLSPKGTLKTRWTFANGRWQIEKFAFSRTR